MIDARLRTLRVLREVGTVTATAEVLYLTPSTVSQQLRQLSRELGVDLLEAEGRRVRLTPAAHTVLDHADVLAAQWERAQADLAEHRSGLAGELRFSAVSTALAALVVPAAARLCADHPELAVDIREGESEIAPSLLLAHRADIAVVMPTGQGPPPGAARFERRPLLQDPQDLLVPAGHRLAARPAVDLAEAAGEPWIGSPDRPDQHHLMLTACAAAGFTPRVEQRANEWFAVSALVARGFGVSLVPRLAPLPPGDGAVRVPLLGPHRPSRAINTLIRRGSAGRPTIARGLAALEDAAREHAPDGNDLAKRDLEHGHPA